MARRSADRIELIPMRWFWIAAAIMAAYSSGKSSTLKNTDAEDVQALIGPVLQQREDIFAYEVLAGALDRSAGANQQLDNLFFALMASIAAIYAIILDKLTSYPRLVVCFLLGAFVISIVGSLLSLFAEDAPNPRSFSKDYPRRPGETRLAYQARYITLAERNNAIRRWKLGLLIAALAGTLFSLYLATSTKLDELEEVGHGKSGHQRIFTGQSCDAKRSQELKEKGLWLAQCG